MDEQWKKLCLLLFVTASVTCFLPLYLTDNDANFEYFDPNSKFDWKEHRLLCLAAVSTALPLLLDTALDYKLPFNTIGPRWVFVISLIIPNVICFHATKIVSSRTISIGVCCVFCRELLTKGALLSFLLHRNCSKGTVQITTFISLALIFQLLCRLWYIFQVPGLGDVWMIVAFVADVCAELMLGWVCITRFLTHKKGVENNTDTFYAFLSLVGHIMKYIMVFGPQEPTYIVVVDIFIGIIATVVPGRQARHQKSVAEHTIQSKRDFVSYISHELRTPLNTVYMGIQLLSTRTAPSTKERKTEVHDIVKDIESSCCIAINILYDAASFDNSTVTSQFGLITKTMARDNANYYHCIGIKTMRPKK